VINQGDNCALNRD